MDDIYGGGGTDGRGSEKGRLHGKERPHWALIWYGEGIYIVRWRLICNEAVVYL